MRNPTAGIESGRVLSQLLIPYTASSLSGDSVSYEVGVHNASPTTQSGRGRNPQIGRRKLAWGGLSPRSGGPGQICLSILPSKSRICPTQGVLELLRAHGPIQYCIADRAAASRHPLQVNAAISLSVSRPRTEDCIGRFRCISEFRKAWPCRILAVTQGFRVHSLQEAP